LIIALLCLAGRVVLLMISNGQAVSSWRVQPTVLISIFSTVANSCLAFALTEGLAISWWNKALKGSTLKGLHERWQFGRVSGPLGRDSGFLTLLLVLA
jgi:hypothetical protein